MQTTVRLAYDDYREVALRARARGWSINDFIAWCVAKQVSPKGVSRHNPLGYVTQPSGNPAHRRREATYDDAEPVPDEAEA